MNTTILGAGISGISASYHLNHHETQIFEKELKIGGHAASENLSGFTVDHGPHVSFTKSDYTRNLFATNTSDAFTEFPVYVRNYFQGTWIDHPAQAHLWQIPEPLRQQCAEEMLVTAGDPISSEPEDYEQWLLHNYGPTFTRIFSAAYTKKYWTVRPSLLSTDWLGPRLPKMTVEQIQKGLVPQSAQNLHYITRVRYPIYGGFEGFFTPMAKGAKINFGSDVTSISLAKREIRFANGSRTSYQKLISTLPLPSFIQRCEEVTDEVREAADQLDCTQLLIVDIFSPQSQKIDGHWFYVYDEDKWSTRIHCIEKLSSNNAPEGWVGIQAEVYFSKYKPLLDDPASIAEAVAGELLEMGLLDADVFQRRAFKLHWRWSPFANVLFTHPRKSALETIWNWLSRHGLAREPDDLDPGSAAPSSSTSLGNIIMAGRFAQWKYFWTDDCVLRGRTIAESC
jgi:protoporphyrinogen oxidase